MATKITTYEEPNDVNTGNNIAGSELDVLPVVEEQAQAEEFVPVSKLELENDGVGKNRTDHTQSLSAPATNSARQQEQLQSKGGKKKRRSSFPRSRGFERGNLGR